MVSFTRPMSITRVSGSFQSHVDRHSVNPGVDYSDGVSGHPVYAGEAGVVAATDWSNSVGWWVTIFFDNGWSADYLHNTRITVAKGQRVSRGSQIAVSGGTGSVATGPHSHCSLRPNHTAGLVNRGNVNMELYVGGAQGGTSSDIDYAFIKAQLGADYVKALQTQLGVTADGLVGTQTVKAWQAKIGTPADGLWGHASNVALQNYLKITADGLWGAGTTAAIKAAITSGTFGATPTPAVSRTVQAQADSNIRSAPTTSVVTTGAYKAGSTVELPFFIKGMNVSGVDIWFVDATKTKFAWAGGFTTQNTAGMVELPAYVPPTPATYYRPTDAPAGSLFGIDVSQYQAGFDFAKYKAGAAEDFVIIKRGGSNGSTYIDTQYAANLKAARAAGFTKIGHYWFNGRDGVKSPTESAQAFLKDFDILPGEIVMLDIENDGTAVAAYNEAEALEWLTEVERQLGVKAYLYMSAALARDSKWKVIAEAGYPLWVAMYSYLTTSPLAGTYKANDVDPLGVWGAGDSWMIHQWTSTVYGVMPGTSAKSLDRNIAKPNAFSKYGFVKRPSAPTQAEYDALSKRLDAALADALAKGTKIIKAQEALA
jgi:GH25 family lysozyme M1 (1,4-beta-N-acetylmuramidase)